MDAIPQIKQLSASVINKIAAGEVIERPASAVKELMENAVDSGARRLDVSVEQGGAQLIRVADDGCGILPDQLVLAVASHATSKIADADDLFHVDTLGFRGEALASISEVSQFVIRSRPSDVTAGAELEVVGGRLSEVAPCGCPVGTTVEVRNLFYNTPVRRKFLKTTQTEMGHISEAFTRIALAHPEVHFTLRHNDRVQFDLPVVENWRERIIGLFGRELGNSLIRVDGNQDDINVYGYVADPSVSRANNRMQYLFLNGRHIRDRALQHALGEAYRGLLLTGRYPVTFLQLEMSPGAVDVNVHPTKLEVRFQDSGAVYARLLGTLRNRFLTTDLTARVENPSEPARTMDDAALKDHRDQLMSWARTAGQGPSEEAGQQAALPLTAGPTAVGVLSPGLTETSQVASEASDPATWSTPVIPEPLNGNPYIDSQAVPTSFPQGMTQLGIQIQNRYLIAANEEGMLVIDQHALHERILYERFRETVAAGTLEVQRLLVPEPVSLTPQEAATAIDNADVLGEVGITVEPFGGDTVLVTSFPAMMAKLGPAETLRQTVDRLMAGGQSVDREDVMDELLQMMSCKAAIKAGDPLSSQEISALLEQRHLCRDAHHCPHGRPTALVFSRDELDRRFKRT